MRESDRLLGDDLDQLGLPDLASRARSGEFNDFFGDHEHAQSAIIEALREEPELINVNRIRLINWVMDGKYNGTQEESREWSESADGQRALNDLKSRLT